MSQNAVANFAPFEERMRVEGLPQIIIDNFHYYYDVLAAGSVGLIGEDTIQPVAAVPDIAEVEQFLAAGRAALKRTVVVKLNGGLGTSMGLDQAKSLLRARDDMTFLDLIARQTISFSQHFESHVPLILMNSFATDADSRAVLARYPELAGPIAQTLMQHKVPKVLQETLAPAEWPENPQLEWCPPGHGEIYIALVTSGMLDELLANGYEHMFISNVDNLGATLDLGILGYIASRHIPFLMEVTDRTEADKKGGHIAQMPGGQLVLREIAQCPEQDLASFQDIKRHKYFNTNNIWLNLPELKRILVESNNVLKLPMIRNAKTLDPKDHQSPPVYQLETAMGAAIGVFPGAQVLRVGRDRFLPVKTCEDLLRLRSDVYELDDNYRLCQARAGDPPVIALDARFYKLIGDFEPRFAGGTPSLRECRRLAVHGDVCFEAGVACKGDVRIVNRAAEQRYVAAGSVLADVEYDLTADVVS
jgi:UTP--glucose-1-phosphate uridylyltransferase